MKNDIDTSRSIADKWETKSKEQQFQINDLEKIRKSLLQQLHELRQEMNPKEVKLQKTTEKLEEFDNEYVTLLNK